MKKLFLFGALFISWAAQAQNKTRLDSFDVSHYRIQLDVNQPNQTISGYTELTIKSKVNNLQQLTLDLLKLSIDSITWKAAPIAYQYNDTAVRINTSGSITQGDSALLRIYYHGHPLSDATWGGFYFNGVYAFNLGVGFAANPNSYGRVWYPCIDDFRSRSTYDYFITADSANKVFCNGLLQSVNTTANKKTWHWQEKRLTPVYLSSVAIAPYATLSWTYKSKIDGRNIPVILNALPADTEYLRSSFQHLDTAIAIYEDVFGAYPFDRIGYNVVPFAGGAMEHTGNIAYPLFAVDGTLLRQTMMAHELAHSWFGGLYNCETSSDMWLNEGWASYCESLFMERLYGKNYYKKYVRENHEYVLHYAHLQENGYRAVSGVPHAHTYGTHSYKKGADIAHTLRGTANMGNGQTALALQRFRYGALGGSIKAPQYSYWNSQDFNRFFAASPENDKDFSCWINGRAMPHIRFGSFQLQKNAADTTALFTLLVEKMEEDTVNYMRAGQKSSGICLSFFSRNWVRFDTCFYLQPGPYAVKLPFNPVFYCLDMDEYISDAITDKYLVMRKNDSTNFEEAMMRVIVKNCSDSALVRVEHHWYPAEQLYCNIPGLYVSNYRYWTVDGIWPADFSASATLNYDGRKLASIGQGGYLDHTLIRKTEDSLVLVYRPHAWAYWQVENDVIKNTGVKNDRQGYFRVNNLKKGQYAWAMYDQALGSKTIPGKSSGLLVYPNPADSWLSVKPAEPMDGNVYLFDQQGREILSSPLHKDQKELSLNTAHLKNGLYIVRAISSSGEEFSTKVLLQQ